MNAVISELKTLDTFMDLSTDDLDALAGICSPVKYSPRDIIAREGVQADCLFAFIKGSVDIWVDFDTDKADLLAVREAPCLVGEMSVADQLPRSATIVSGSNLSGYSIDADSFHELLEKRGSIALSLMKGISRLVRLSNNSFVSELRASNAELIQANKDLKSAQRKLLRQERLSNLGKFSSMIIHDLRNPLSVIKGYADLLELKLEGQSKDLFKYASQIRRETTRLTGLTNEWLDYSRGDIRLNYSPVNIEKLFNMLKESIVPGFKSKDIEITWNMDFSEAALMDMERILRVLINLCDNARKACNRGGSVEISAFKQEQYLVLKIRDDGVGMDEKTLHHVFEPFYSSSDRGGTGLGMHIVKTVVEAHEGTIEISSKPGKGTGISISLPLRM